MQEHEQEKEKQGQEKLACAIMQLWRLAKAAEQAGTLEMQGRADVEVQV